MKKKKPIKSLRVDGKHFYTEFSSYGSLRGDKKKRGEKKTIRNRRKFKYVWTRQYSEAPGIFYGAGPQVQIKYRKRKLSIAVRTRRVIASKSVKSGIYVLNQEK